ncbi:MAG: FGGY-family carbohydrate kinase [Oscillospiraceae bacterium]
MELVLSIDCGTQSLRTILFDKKGEIRASAKVSFVPYYSRKPGYAEQDPSVYYDALCKACAMLKRNYQDLFDRIAGVVVTTQRDTIIIVDENGNPLRPAILWIDQRTASFKLRDYFSITEISAYRLVGMDKISEQVMQKSKAYWIKEHEPELWKKTHKFLLLSGYLNYSLTGEMKDSIGNMIGHLPFSAKTFGYPTNLKNIAYRQFGVEERMLAKLIPVGEILGHITKKCSQDMGLSEGIKVIAGASDKGAETLATGCLDETTASLSFGTTATVQITTDKYIEPLKFIPPYPAAIKGKYNPEYEVFRGYWLISWFKKEFAHHEILEAEKRNISPEEVLNESLREIPCGSEGLMLQPYWTPGIKMKDARGSIIGFSDVHTRVHIYRAIIEGINYGLLEGIEKIEHCTKKKITKAFVSGGGSQSKEICQITADILGIPVCRIQTHEASGLGAAIIGYVGIGCYASIQEAVSNMVRYADRFEPDKINAALYKRLYNEGYKKIFAALNPVYSQINKILNGGTNDEQTI